MSSTGMLIEKQHEHGELLEPATVAEMLHVKPQTLSVWRHKGIGLDYVRVGSCVRYTPKAVAEYVEKQTVRI